MDIEEAFDEESDKAKTMDETNAGHKNIFDWYQLVCKQGDYELEISLKRFYENCKLHLFIFGGIFAVWAYSLQHEKWLLLGSVLFGFVAIIHAKSWKAQILSSCKWEAHWRQAAGNIELTSAFRKCVGMEAEGIIVWARLQIIDIDPEQRKNAPSQKMLLRFVEGLMVVYLIITFAGIGFLLAQIKQAIHA